MPPVPPPKPQTLKVPPSGTGHGSAPMVFEDEPPRLAVCLNMTAVDYPEGTTGEGWYAEHTLDANDPKSIEQILAWIDDRIHRPLTEAWAGPAGELHEAWDAGPAEDAWARALSEIVFGMRYGGPGECYFGSAKWDSYIFSRLQRRSLDYFEVHKARKKATPPATFLEVQLFKNKLEKDRKHLKSAMIDNDDPAISLASACQHLTTYGTISRGFTIEEHMNGSNYSAGQNKAKDIFDPDKFPGGRWYPTNDAHLKVSVATGLEAPPAPRGAKEAPPKVDPAIGPGGIYCYNPFGDAKFVTVYAPPSQIEINKDGLPVVKQEYQGRIGHTITESKTAQYKQPERGAADQDRGMSMQVPADFTRMPPTSEEDADDTYVEALLPATGQKKGSHIFLVLRVSKDKERLQRLDTSNGHPLNEHEEHTIMEPLGKAGIYEGNIDRQVYKGNVYCGMGVLPPAPEDLNAQADFLRRARPIGLLRLVITERVPSREMSERHVLFVSRMIRMYGDGDSDNFWVSRCAWSLRNTPGFINLQPWWIISVPRGELARMMWAHGARKRKLSSMVQDVSIIRLRKVQEEQRRTGKKIEPPSPGLKYGEDFRDTIVLTNDAQGNALYWQRKRSELSFGLTTEQFQGNAIPDAICDRVAPSPGRNKGLEISWNGQRFDDRYTDPDIADVDIEVPSLFLDGEAEQAAAQADATSLLADPDRVEAVYAGRIDDSDPSGDVELA